MEDSKESRRKRSRIILSESLPNPKIYKKDQNIEDPPVLHLSQCSTGIFY